MQSLITGIPNRDVQIRQSERRNLPNLLRHTEEQVQRHITQLQLAIHIAS